MNLDIYKGEILALLGENGSGKTTLMNMLSGIYFPDEGQIFINGKEDGDPITKGCIKAAASVWCISISNWWMYCLLRKILYLGLEGKLNIERGIRKDRTHL